MPPHIRLKESFGIPACPAAGALSGVPYETMNAEAWPYVPFAITNDVPLSMTLGYTLGGFAERAANYVAHCTSNGVFRTTAFPVPTSATASNALSQVFTSSAWRALKWKDFGLGWSYALDESYAKDMLRRQVGNMANPQGGANGRQPSGSDTNQTSPAAAPRRSP